MIALSLEHVTAGSLVLEGVGLARPFTGACYQPASGPGESIADSLILVLESSSPAQVAAGLSSLEKYLNLANAASKTLSGQPVYVSCTLAPGEPAWRSRLESAWLEHLGGQLGMGSLGLRLHFTRENAWEGPETILPVTNPNGLRLTDGLLIFNSAGSNLYDNYLEVASADLSGSLPARARLELLNQGLTSLAYLFCGLDRCPLDGSYFSPWLEGEDAAGGQPLDDPSCSRGKAQRAAWSGTAPNDLLTWALPFPASEQAGGRYFKAFLRLSSGTAYSDLSLRFRLELAGHLAWEGPWEAVPANQELVELNLLPIPPYLAGLRSLAGLTITLQARRGTAGDHILLVDLLYLLPLDAWRRLASSGLGAPPGWTLYDDALTGYVYTGQGSLLQNDFASYGDQLTLTPGLTQRLYLLLRDNNGQAALGHQLLAKLYYRPRVRVL
jgi:hypothetical protein